MQIPLSWLGDWYALDGYTPDALAALFTNAGLEVEAIETIDNDTVLTLNITPNRGDCLSMIGAATELAAILSGTLAAALPIAATAPQTALDDLRVQIDAPDACPLYTARRIRRVQVNPSPAHIQARLLAAGMRPINNIVDATNYVMLELGQPLHAFDARTIHDNTIRVGHATDGEQFITLDGITRTLAATDLLIYDSQGPIALAGVMGGANSDIHDDTTDVILESAWFAPTVVRATSKRLGLSTESSRRFERHVDPQRVASALERAAQFIVEWSGGTADTAWVAVQHASLPAACAINLDPVLVTRVLGVALSSDTITQILKRIGCTVVSSGTQLAVQAPTSRPDLTRPIDLVEEVARLYGYQHIPATAPQVTIGVASEPATTELRQRVRHQLAAHGFSEAVHYAFEPQATTERFAMPGITALPLANPLGEDAVALKTTLLSGLIECAAYNLRQGHSTVRLFELRPVQRGDATPMMLAGVHVGPWRLATWQHAAQDATLYQLKGMLDAVLDWSAEDVQFDTANLPDWLHPGHAAWVLHGTTRIGLVGELTPALVRTYDFATPPLVFEWNLDAWYECTRRIPIYSGIVRHPGIRRDVALLIDAKCTAQAIEQAIWGTQQPWMLAVELFDVYAGDKIPAGQKSLAYAITYRDSTRTLTDEDVNAVHAQVVQQVTSSLGATVR